jgi:hypothetical protein
MWNNNKSMFLYFTVISALKVAPIFKTREENMRIYFYTSRHHIKDTASRILSMTNETRFWNNCIVISMYQRSCVTHMLHPSFLLEKNIVFKEKYSILCRSVMLDSFSCSFSSISFLTKRLWFNSMNYKIGQAHFKCKDFEFGCLTPLSAIFQLYHGNQF